MYKILPSEQGCNTSRMVRVVQGHTLIALFLSYSDALEYIDKKKRTKP